MGKVRHHFALGALLLILGGCGAYSRVAEDATEDTADGAALVDGPAADTAPAAAPGRTSPGPSSLPSDPVEFTSPTFDPLDLGPFEPEDVPELLSLYTDTLLLDLVVPLGPGAGFDALGPSYEYTYLEQLCRDLGQPDHVCRQRYGD